MSNEESPPSGTGPTKKPGELCEVAYRMLGPLLTAVAKHDADLRISVDELFSLGSSAGLSEAETAHALNVLSDAGIFRLPCPEPGCGTPLKFGEETYRPAGRA